MSLYKFIRIFAGILLLIFIPLNAAAAVLFLETNQKEYQEENVFILPIRIDTEGECVNAVEISLSFSLNVLEAVDFSKGDSILTIWIDSPKSNDFTEINKNGFLSFSGGIPGGYCGKIQGDPGKSDVLARLIFKVKNNEQRLSARLSFLDNSKVFLNDGLGTPAKLKTKELSFSVLSFQKEFLKDGWQEEIKKDNIPPESFLIEVSRDPGIFDGKYFIVFSATDKQTGLDYFEIKEGKSNWQRAESPYLLKDQKLNSIIKVKAIDKAGNERIAEYLPEKRPTPLWQKVLILFFSAMIIFLLVIKKLNAK